MLLKGSLDQASITELLQQITFHFKSYNKLEFILEGEGEVQGENCIVTISVGGCSDDIYEMSFNKFEGLSIYEVESILNWVEILDIEEDNKFFNSKLPTASRMMGWKEVIHR